MNDELSYIYVPFLHKSKVSPDGSIEVYGKMTGPQLDLDEQIVDADWAREAVTEWFKAAANIRQMHSANLPPAGKGLEVKEDDDGFWLRAKIIEPYAVKAIQEDVYTGYSIGIKAPRVQRDNTAKNGRIVGGTIVETSVVDYPCLSSAKFVKSDERAQAAKFILAERFRDDVAFIGKFAPLEEVEETRTKLITTPTDLEDQKEEKRDVSQQERERLADRGAALPDGSFPIANEDDLRNAIRAVGRAKNPSKAKRHIIARANALGHSDLIPDDWKMAESDASLWYEVKRAHDALCPAYDLADVLFTYPELAKNGLAAAIGPGVKSQIFALLDHEVEEDGGSGEEADGIEDLAKAYNKLCMFLYGEALEAQMEGQPPAYLMDARADLHKSFLDTHPGQRYVPKSASFTFPAVAGSESGMPASSESFAGNEMTSPGGSASYSPPTNSFMLPSGSDSKTRGGPPANTDSGSTSTPAIPGSESGMPGGGLSRSSDSIPKLADLMASLHDALGVIDKMECPAGTAPPVPAEQEETKVAESEPEKTEPEEKAITPDPDVVRKADLEDLYLQAVKAATKAAEARHGETESEMHDEIESLKARVEELSKEPDPKQSVLRKAVGPERPSAANNVAEAQVLEKRAELKSQIAEWQAIFEGSPEFATRDYARRMIAHLEASELLKA